MFIMTEKVEKGKKEVKESKIKKAWSKVKKPLATGILAGGLLLSPVQKAESIGFDAARTPPTYAADIIKKEYNIGWRFILMEKENWKNEKSKPWLYADAAINYFKNAYEKDKKPESLYLCAYSIYSRAIYEPTFEKTETRLIEALELVEKRLKEVPDDFDFIDLKQIIFYNLAKMYYQAYNHHPAYREDIDESKLDFYKQKSIEYCNKWLEFYKDISERWDGVKIYCWVETYKEEEIIRTKNNFKEDYNDEEKEIKELLDKLKVR